MKVALIHYRLILRGGLETRLINYMDYLIHNGHDVTVICAKKSNEVTLPKGVRLIRLSLGLMPKVFRPWYFNRKLAAFMKKEAFDFSLSLGRTSHQDTVLAPCNHLGYLEAIGKKRQSIDDKMQTHLDEVAFAHSKIIYAASEMMKDELIHFYHVPAEKIHILHPPSNVRKFNQDLRPQRDQLRKKFNIRPDKYAFAFVSTSHKRKGIELLLNLFKELQDEPFELLIAGHPKVRTNLPNVKFLGFVTEGQELYTAVDFTIHPSFYEPFGQIITESLLCGTPVLISDKVGAKEIISDKEGVVLSSFELKDWLDLLRSLPNRQFDIDANFGQKQGLSLEQHMEKMLAIYKESKT